MRNVQMLPYPSASSLTPRATVIPPAPAKIPTSKSNCQALIVRTPCVILRLYTPLLALSSSILKPIFASSSLYTPRASAFQKYLYPDPNPEFARAETNKFKAELFHKLSVDKDMFGDDLDAVIEVCAKIFYEFLRREYGGPGTLLVEPFTDMLVALKERKLPGAPLATRASLLWAQNYVDQDWETWHSNSEKN